jgi:double-strand break repair protein MRE11
MTNCIPRLDADTIRILVATDNHVGYNERDSTRHSDSWNTFHEIMCLAKDRDVDMVLLAGDLFHDNKPSRKSMAEVMKALRTNCLGDKPCELEMLSDASENFAGLFDYANYEDPDINVAIPVFSIHGNHDDPSGGDQLAALDLLQIAGLVNYYGRTPESDNIEIKPVLLQKGRTKLALYGMSNVRDERLFRTFRDGKVKFFRPGQQTKEWFNLMSVHQNHHAYTETGYLPENFLPDFMDLVVWGHEHECLIDPKYNQEMGFHVMQPGSSVATSLMPGEAVPKQVSILSVTGKEFETEHIRLKSVRPFVMKEIVLSEEKAMKSVWNKNGNRTEVTRHLNSIVEKMIQEANAEWWETHTEEDLNAAGNPPEPLIRLRVEYSAPEGGHFDCENPQRFSNNFIGRVANVNDVIQFYRKKANATRKSKPGLELPDEKDLNTTRVDKLVREFLEKQSLTILPRNSFGDAVSLFIDKDDKHAMEMFVNDSLASQVKHLLANEAHEDEDIVQAMSNYREKLEEMFAAGTLKNVRKGKLKPKPDTWDSDLDGEWEDQPGAYGLESDPASDEDVEPTPKPAGRGRGKAAATTRQAATTTRKTASTATKKAPATQTAKSRTTRNKVVEEEEEEDEDNDVIMIDDDDELEEDESQSQGLFVKPTRSTTRKPPARKVASRSVSPVKKPATSRAKAPTRTAATPASQSLRQGKLNFGSQAPAVGRKGKIQEPVRYPAASFNREPVLNLDRVTMRSPMMTMPSSRLPQPLALPGVVNEIVSNLSTTTAICG